MGHPEALGSGGRAQLAAATPGDRDEDTDTSSSALLIPAQPIAVTTAGTGDTATSPCQVPHSCQVFAPFHAIMLPLPHCVAIDTALHFPPSGSQ